MKNDIMHLVNPLGIFFYYRIVLEAVPLQLDKEM